MKLRVLSILLLLPAMPLFAQDAKKIKEYVAEVQKHLKESYIDPDKVDAAAQPKAFREGLVAGLDMKEFAGLSAEEKKKIKESVEKQETIAGAVDALAALDVKFDRLRLADSGCNALIRAAGDAYGRVLTSEDVSRLVKMIDGRQPDNYLGFMLRPVDRRWTVAYVPFGYAAWQEGVQHNDEILEIDGQKLAGMPLAAVMDLATAKPGESRTILLRRPGYPDPLKIVLRQRKVQPPDVLSQMLGTSVGYVRLTQFTPGCASRVRGALRDLSKQGMKALIFDVRDNPGGALNAAVDIADEFLADGAPIARTESRYEPAIFGFKLGKLLTNDYKATRKTEFEKLPMVLLVNAQSASASEFLAGAIRDNGRAKLVGETTYGKGVGQTLILLSSMGTDRFLYLTVLKYFSPTSGCPNGVGVKAHVSCPDPKPEAASFRELLALREKGVFDAYVDERWGKDRELFEQLAWNDKLETKRYPEFETFAGGLKAKLSADETRQEMRRAIRRKVEEARGRLYACDLESDEPLQRALVMLLDGMD